MNESNGLHLCANLVSYSYGCSRLSRRLMRLKPDEILMEIRMLLLVNSNSIYKCKKQQNIHGP